MSFQYKTKEILRISTPRIFALLKALGYPVKVLIDLRGVFPRLCNLCGYQGRFVAFGLPPRYDAKCRACGSVDRQRLVALADAEHHLFEGKSVLHFAAEGVLTDYVKARNPAKYTTADYIRKDADLNLNIEKIDLPDASYEVVLCSHVLEHVDDRAALREIHRILAPRGLLVLLVPICEAWAATYENPAVTDPAERELHFGQHDHVRYYGRDVRERIQSAGFELSEFQAVEPLVSRHGLMRGDTVFLCQKKPSF